MTHRRYVLSAATAVAIGVAAILVGTGPTSTTTTTAAPLRDANVPAPQLALPYYPHCAVQPFDIGQFDSLAPGSAKPSEAPLGRFHVVAICDNGTITISSLGSP
jgi:hypothetical protein